MITLIDKPIRITLAWECLPALDGTVHAVDPDPDALYSDEYSVSLCGKALIVRGGTVDISDPCPVCIEISGERQREFDVR